MRENNDKKMINIPNNIIKIEFSGMKYECLKKECFVKDIKPGFRYALKYNKTVSGNLKYSFIAIFKDEKGIILAKKYIENNEAFTAHKKAKYAAIEIFAESREKSCIVINEICFDEIGENRNRIVTLAAAAIAYGLDRTTEMNLRENLSAIDNAASVNPDIILLTECFYDRNVYSDESLIFKAIDKNDPVISIMKERAVKYNTYIAFSVLYRLENGNISNMGIIIGRNGEITGEYKKTHLTIHEHDMQLEPGDTIPVFNLDFGRVGFAICWDLFFPEHVRKLHLQGAEVILNPSAGYKLERVSERACESGTYIVCSGTHSSEDTCIVSPEGKTIAKGNSASNFIYASVDLSDEYYIPWLSTSSSATMKNVYKFERRADLYTLKKEGVSL